MARSLLLVLLALVAAACRLPAAPTPTSPLPGAGQPATVVEVVDGDTIRVRLGGQVATVRYIGVDTPETSHPTIGEEPYGREATQRNRELVEGRTVYLERDVSETDRYGRLLRYVWLDGTRMVNAILVQEGYAQAVTYPPDVKYQDLFLQLQREAREARRGLWALTPTPAAPDGGEWFTSSHPSARYYYCPGHPARETLSPQYLETFPSEEALLERYAGARQRHPDCG